MNTGTLWSLENVEDLQNSDSLLFFFYFCPFINNSLFLFLASPVQADARRLTDWELSTGAEDDLSYAPSPCPEFTHKPQVSFSLASLQRLFPSSKNADRQLERRPQPSEIRPGLYNFLKMVLIPMHTRSSSPIRSRSPILRRSRQPSSPCHIKFPPMSGAKSGVSSHTSFQSRTD